MSAIDQDWHPVFSLRKVKGDVFHDKAVEIRVEPSEEPTAELLLAVAVGYHNFDGFFRTSSDGGGAA
jgi:hypothetical protein